MEENIDQRPTIKISKSSIDTRILFGEKEDTIRSLEKVIAENDEHYSVLENENQLMCEKLKGKDHEI